jgi:hypothetical protein
METKHTPGPWTVFHGTQTTYGPNRTIMPHYTIRRDKDPNNVWFSEAETDANAALIAAAPDLYDGLADLNESVEQYLAAPSTDHMNGLTAALRFARAVIRRVKGETA